jgi:hypothetical protein
LIDGKKYSLKWKKSSLYDTVFNARVYKLELLPLGFSISGTTRYFFSPNFGIVGIDGHDNFLMREDKRYLFKENYPGPW